MSQLQQNRSNEANTLQQNRTNEANSLQQNRDREANYLQYNRVNTYNNYSGSWGGYYSGLGFGAGMAIGATLAVLPAAAMAHLGCGQPLLLRQWRLLCAPRWPIRCCPTAAGCRSQQAAAILFHGVLGGTAKLDCGGAFYQTVPQGTR